MIPRSKLNQEAGSDADVVVSETEIAPTVEKVKTLNALKKEGFEESKFKTMDFEVAQRKAESFRNRYPQNEYEVFAKKVKGETVYGIGKRKKVAGAETAQTTPAEDDADGLFDNQEETVSKKESVEPVVKENLTTETAATAEESLEVEETPEVKSAYANLKDRSAEIGFTFDKFYEKYTPQLDAIIAKASNQFRTLGDEIVDDWRSAAYEAMAKAYMGYNPQSGVKIRTYATKAVVNAINEVNRKHKAETIARGGRVSLDQTNAQGEALHEAVVDENQVKESDSISSRENPQEAKRRITESAKLSPVQKKIVDLFNQDLSPSEVIRKLGKRFGEEGHEYMSKEEFQHQIVAIRTIAEEEGVLYSRKRGTDKNGSVRNIEEVNRKFNDDLDRQIAGTLPKGYIHQLGTPGDILLSTGVPNLPIELSSTRLEEKSKQENHPFNIDDLKDLPKALQNPVAVFAYGDPTKAQNIIVEIQSGGNNYLVGLLFPSDENKLTVNFIKGLFPKNTSSWLRWIEDGKTLYLNKEKVQSLIAQQRTNLADVDNLDLNSINNIIENFKNASDNLEFSRKRLHQQINPIVRDGKVRDEYADLLAKKEYTPTTLKELQNKAFEWILERGGIVKAAQDILDNKAPADSAVAEIARRYILNSDVFADNMSVDDRVKLNTLEINERSKAGLTLRSMRLDSLNLKDVASVQAILNKLHKDMPSKDLQKLRNDIMKNLGIDIFKLPKDIVDDKSKLDALLRAELANKAKLHDKLYEYWINAILSGPSTHASNFFGNTANAVYELGIKRFTEALVNIAAGRKDGATFGEFKAMQKAFNWSNAVAAAKEAFDLEVIDPSGKFLENSNTAIGGKTGRAIRTTGRLLKAADAFAKALIQPMETAAYAYRMGVQEGLTGAKLQEYIQNQLTDKDSKAYQWAKERAKELTFQEDPGSAVKYLMAMKESDGSMGIILKMFLPFLKTPANILRQGVRKGPLGIVNLAWETGKLALGKRDFDGQYVSRVAEQLIALGVVMALAGLSDDDELPVITGTSAPYGSAEYGFKGNKVPPYSIRIGNTWYSYQKIEPFATGLAAIADGIQAFRDVRNGKDGTAVMKELIGSGIKTIGEKSYLDSIGEIIKMVQDPERNAMRPVTNLLSSSVPALWRQTRQAFTEEVGDSKSRSKGLDWWREQFFTVTNRAGITTAIPKIDYFGREVKKDDWGDTPLSPIGRILSVKRVEADSNMNQAERLIWNYNQKNPNSEYYPSIPGNTFTVDGKKMYLSGEAYRDYAMESGKLALKQIHNGIRGGYLDVNNPDEQDIKLIKSIFARARKEMRKKYLKRAKNM